jgi:hypothetical protein
MQYLEHTVTIKIQNEHRILDYYRCVDDILIIYNTYNTNIENTLEEFNPINPELKFAVKKETQNKINYLDLTIPKRHRQLTFGI